MRLLFLLSLILSGLLSWGQIRKGDALRNRIDSLNKVSYDHPVAVTKMADSLLKITKRQKKHIDYGLLLQVKGVAATSLGNNTQALRHHMDSYALFDSIGNVEAKIFALVNIATVQLNLENAAKAKAFLFKALELSIERRGDELRYIFVNLGVAYHYEGNREKAIIYFQKAIPYLEKAHDYNGLAVNYHNIAEDCLGLGQLDKAEIYERKAFFYQKKSGSKNTLGMIALSLGHLYNRKGEIQNAKKYLEIGGKAARELQSPYYMESYYEGMADWHKAAGDYKKSNDYLLQLITLRDTMQSEANREANARIEAQFQHRLKSKEIALLKVQKALDDATIEKKQFWWMVFAGTSILCVVIIFILYRNYQLKQKANRLLQLEKDELSQLNDKLHNENILSQFETLKNQVSPHFLFNSLNALSAMIASQPEKAVLFANSFSKIFRNTLESKDKHIITLSEELQHVNAYLELQQMRFGENLIVETIVSLDKLSYFLPPFSLQMVIENAIKHNTISTAAPLCIKITTLGDFLVVANNLQPRHAVEKSTSIGLKNIRSRYGYITDKVPVFEVDDKQYRAKLPLIKQA